MSKIILALLVTATVTFGLFQKTPAELEFERIFQMTPASHEMLLKKQDNLFQVETIANSVFGQYTAYGSAVQIADGLFVTAKHVVDGMIFEKSKIYVNADEFIVPLYAIKSPTSDVALLITKKGAEINPKLEIKLRENPNFGAHEILFKIGFSKALSLTSAEMETTGFTNRDGEIMVSGGGTHGDSGCPIFDAEGTLVGILVAGLDQPMLQDLPKEKSKKETKIHRAQDIINHHKGAIIFFVPINKVIDLLNTAKMAQIVIPNQIIFMP